MDPWDFNIQIDFQLLKMDKNTKTIAEFAKKNSIPAAQA